jgi:hypothetical protein
MLRWRFSRSPHFFSDWLWPYCGLVSGGAGGAGGVMAPPVVDHFTLSRPGGTDYAQQITTGTPRLSDLPMALEGAG